MEHPSLKLFIIYAHEDKVYKDELLKSLKLLQKNGLVEAWHDRDLVAGDDWDKVIRGHLQSAHIILPIISIDFFNSDYIEQVEIVEAFERYDRGEAHILPIIARQCRWTDDPRISRLQALPENGRPIAKWESRDDAFDSVYDGIKAKILEIQQGRKKAEQAARMEKEEKAAEETRRREDAERQKQEETARAKNLPDMVLVKGGTFQMGEKGVAGPVHAVTLNDFYIGKYAVTFEEYDRFCDETKRQKPGDAGWGRGKRPVINVSWDDAQVYCAWLSKVSGEKFRLPTEAEWEYAARGGSQSKGYAYSGSNEIDQVAWYNGNAGSKTHRVGEKKANELGLHDMSGNVWELCEDWYGDYPKSAQTNPKGPASGSNRVGRGGSWFSTPARARVARRYVWDPDSRLNNLGFRLARTL